VRARRLGPGLALLLALGACGVPADDEARTLGTPPFGLMTTTTTVPPATVPPEEGFSLQLYWVTPDDQVAPGDPVGLPEAPTFQDVLDLLSEGPPVGEAPTDDTTTTTVEGEPPPPSPLRSYITEGLSPFFPEDDEDPAEERRSVGPYVVRVEHGVIDVLMADRFRDEAPGAPLRFRLGIAQVVCTVTQFENVDTVRFFDSRGQFPLVNLDAVSIEVATRDNIGQCDPPASEDAPSEAEAEPTTTAAPAAESPQTTVPPRAGATRPRP
jgi:hypothetical protein